MTRTLDDLDWPVRTARLLIRRATPEDAGATWAYRTDPATGRWQARRPTDEWSYSVRFDTPGTREVTLVVELDGTVVGDLYVETRDGWAQGEVAEAARRCEAELGWTLDPAHHGRGLGTEAVRALLGICFDGLGVRRVTAGCFVDNVASWRVMEKAGMRREAHHVADSLHRDLGWLDGYVYALLAQEWRAPTPTTRSRGADRRTSSR